MICGRSAEQVGIRPVYVICGIDYFHLRTHTFENRAAVIKCPCLVWDREIHRTFLNTIVMWKETFYRNNAKLETGFIATPSCTLISHHVTPLVMMSEFIFTYLKVMLFKPSLTFKCLGLIVLILLIWYITLSLWETESQLKFLKLTTEMLALTKLLHGQSRN